MNIQRIIPSSTAFAISLLTLTGCRTDSYVGSPYHPGPVVGVAVGTGVGVVAGNVVGVGTGAVQGVVGGTTAALDPSYHMVRHWVTQTTADGRKVQVPVDVLVDKYGRPVAAPPPTGNLPPPSGSLPEPPIGAPVR